MAGSKMNPNRFSILIVFLLLAGQSMLTASDLKLTLQPESSIRLDGDGTIHSWSAQTRDISGQWETTTNWLSISTSPVPHHCESHLTVSIQAASLGSIDLTGKPTTNLEGRWIRHAIRDEKHPTIFFVMNRLTLTNALREPIPTWEFTVRGKLTLAGVTNLISFPARLTHPEATQFKITGTTELKLKDFAIEPPLFQSAPNSNGNNYPHITIFSNEVKLTFNLVFKPTGAQMPGK